MEKENQYSIVAREAYLNILGKGMLFEKAWSAAAEKIIPVIQAGIKDAQGQHF